MHSTQRTSIPAVSRRWCNSSVGMLLATTASLCASAPVHMLHTAYSARDSRAGGVQAEGSSRSSSTPSRSPCDQSRSCPGYSTEDERAVSGLANFKDSYRVHLSQQLQQLQGDHALLMSDWQDTLHACTIGQQLCKPNIQSHCMRVSS